MQDNTYNPTTNWSLEAVIDWLFKQGRMLDDEHVLVRELGQMLFDHGAPISRFRLSLRTIHPLVTGKTSLWERDIDNVAPISVDHGIEGRSSYIGSPIEFISKTRSQFRKRLNEELLDSDHPALHDQKARGTTDYFGLPMIFTNDELGTLVFSTDVKDGFSPWDICQFEKLANYLAPIIEVFSARFISHAIAHAYLGSRTGQRVLDGQITRGHIENIKAAILISDIRDWTGLNNRVSSAQALSMANHYFEIIANAVEDNGGEILKFMGDGVLAIFPMENSSSSATSQSTCELALAAAQQALKTAKDTDPALDLEFGIGMHFGEVQYGNIGSKTRIDFTVMGQAVNTASRIESLCSKVDRSILYSQDFAQQLAEPSILVADETLKGYNTKFKVMSTQ